MFPHRYVSNDEDSHRWLDLPLRKGDIVISTRSKSGTTWMQMICALLVFQTSDLPAPLSELSPWLDWTGEPQAEVYDRLAAQRHRRFIKTHTPFDGIPCDKRMRRIVVARHPLDAAVSMYHQGNNLNRERIRELIGAAAGAGGSGDRGLQAGPTDPPAPRPDLHEWLIGWINEQVDPRESLDSLQGVMWHLKGAWACQEKSNTLLVHYADLSADLEGEMRRIARWLHIKVDESRWAELVRAATFSEMKSRASALAPDPNGIMKDCDAFFRRGVSGAAAEVLSEEELRAYYDRADDLAPGSLLKWLHRS
nr:sulfotransferase domain-containing protein [Glycomyces buryatensis]